MRTKGLVIWSAVATLLASPVASAAPTIDQLQASAKVYAGLEWPGTYVRLCIPSVASASQVIPTINPALYPGAGTPAQVGQDPPLDNWYAAPAQVGDNLYFLGARDHSTYALVSKKGNIILIDGNFEYATKDEIIKGLGFLGLDINKVRYAIFSHAHGDHDGGAYIEQADMPNATIIYGTGDWPGVLQRTVPHATRSGLMNDGVDGRVVSIDDVSVQIITMPGHTPGTLSFLFEFKDGKEQIRVAYVGGTAIPFNEQALYYDNYLASSQKFARAAAAYGATAIFSNHTEFDLAYFKANAAQRLRDIDKESNLSVPNKYLKSIPNPYDVGQRAVLNYFGVVELCTKAAKLRSTGSL